MGVPPILIHLNRISLYKPSSYWGNPHDYGNPHIISYTINHEMSPLYAQLSLVKKPMKRTSSVSSMDTSPLLEAQPGY